MIQHTCSNCGAVFGDEQFCPSCGQWIDPITTEDADEEFHLTDTPPDDEWESAPVEMLTCPSCGTANPARNRHCEECGARLHQGPLPIAPKPALGTSAGLRAVIAVSGVLIVVFVIAAIINALGGDEPSADASTTVPATSTTVASAAVKIVPLAITCSSVAAGFDCNDLISEDGNGWNDENLRGKDAEFVITFAPAVALEQLVIFNSDDEDRFRRNYRIQGFEIEADDFDLPLINDVIPDETGAHVIQLGTLATNQLTIRVISTYAGEAVDNNPPWETLLIDHFEFVGRESG